MDSYQSLSAQVYNFDKPIGKSFGDLEYYQSRLLNNASQILEPAVGTGRIMIPLLQQGYNIQGFDLSKEMLSYCEENLQAVNLPTNIIQQASFTNFNYDQAFDAIIIPSGTFLLMTDYDEIKLALQKFYAALNPNGKLIFDLFFQNNFQLGRTNIKTFTLSAVEKITLTMTESHIDYAHQVATYIHRYEHWVNNQLTTTELETFRLKWLGIEEIQLLLKEAGFTEITISADYQHKKVVTNETEIFTVEAYRL
ncbi:class I SAM-dependent methyltransferase [Wohlfahrtiimonas larvae]|uniref:Class I SAM-dependent methyltransferase n=1 Tax=Wohlfahrtiimonas larvae TaxID=1157986 RepID=A0ABP9MT16_9GAMM|nr:class I SAM-dependent methyltransferase [Wohlfahrtiimonas larvae]